MLISKQSQFDSFVDELREATSHGAPLAFDTEFLSEKRYYARLCLVQVLAPTEGGVVEAAIDPFNLDITPLAALIDDPKIIKIVHSGSSDLQIFRKQFGIEPRNIFDTQIAAAFLGFGHQIGYADLVRKITSTSLSKTMQYTDWSARPLSEEQIEYAMADVRYLPPLLEFLREELSRRNRLGWAQTEFARAEARAVRVERDEDAYKRLNLSGLNRKQLAVLREVAMLREGMAREIDKPPSFVMPDLAMIQFARQQPKSIGDLRAVRGMPNINDATAKRLIGAVNDALASDPQSWPVALSNERPDPRLDSIVALLGVVASARAASQDVSRTYLAPRDGLWNLASWWLEHGKSDTVPDLDLLKDWRGEILGRDLLRLLNGEAVIILDNETGLPELRAM
jgi:ribonuclease D